MATVAQPEAWHLDKKVPIAIIISLLIQTVTFISIAASWKTSVESRLEYLEKADDVKSSQGDRILILEQQLKYIVDSLARIEKKLDIVEQGKSK
jgi:hypothetical protein